MLYKVEDDMDNLLRVSELSEGLITSRVAFLLRVRRLYDKNGEPFLRFYFRTADGVTVIGRKFRINSSTAIGEEILTAQKTVVSIWFETQVFGGSYSLAIDRVVFNHDIPASSFFDKYEGVDLAYDNLAQIAKEYNARFVRDSLKRISLLSVLNGKQGGLLYLLNTAISSLCSYKDEDFFPTLVNVFMACIKPYADYCLLLDKTEFVPKIEQIALLNGLDFIEDGRVRSITMDTLSALINVAKPEHFISHLINQSIGTAMRQLNMLDRIKISPVNTVIDYEGETMISY